MTSAPVLPPRARRAAPPSPPATPAEKATIVRPAGAAGLAVALALQPELWSPLVEYRDESRWTHLLDPELAAAVLDPSMHPELAGAQIWLLTWLSGQGTPLHDHGKSAGAFAVAQGTLTETVVTGQVLVDEAPAGPPVFRSPAVGRAAPKEAATDLTAGRVRWFGPHYVHQVVNSQPEPAVSIHVYTPPLRLMNTYRIAPEGLVRTGTERAGVNW